MVASCNLSENALTTNSSNHEKVGKPANISNSNNGTNIQLISNKNAETPIAIPETYVGRWGGTGGGLFEINKASLHNVLNNKTYKYDLIEVRKAEANNQYLLHLLDDPGDGYIKRFVLLEFVTEDHLYYFGYDTYEDSLKNSYSGMGEFFKNISSKK